MLDLAYSAYEILQFLFDSDQSAFKRRILFGIAKKQNIKKQSRDQINWGGDLKPVVSSQYTRLG